MRTNTKKYTIFSLVTSLAVVALSLGAFSSAQTVIPVRCTVSSASVNTHQAAIFTAAGGNGTYVWSGWNLNITNATGNQFAVSYPNPGSYSITVTSAGYTASCSMTVVATASTGNLVCSPATQNVMLGQIASFAASGGNGSYIWSSPDITILNATGSGFSANYAGTGLKTMTVSSAGQVDTCAVNVLSNGTVTPPVTPGLPNTGGGYNQ